MATLIDAKYKVQGKTVLYVPNEGLTLTVQQATKNKEYVQRLESMSYFDRFTFLFVLSASCPCSVS